MIDYDWKFHSIEVIYDSGSMQNIITGTRWEIEATYTPETYGPIKKLSTEGYVRFSPPSPESFIPFNSITKEQMISWTVPCIGGEEEVNMLKTNLSSSLGKELNPTTGVIPAPWLN